MTNKELDNLVIKYNNELIQNIRIIVKNSNKNYDDSMPGLQKADELEAIQAAFKLEKIIKNIADQLPRNEKLEFPSVTCPICKTTTYHPKDVRDYLTVGLWCNNCDKRTTESMVVNESNLRTQSKLSVIREIISKFQINTNRPYSHNNKDYLSAEDCLSEILQRLLDEN
jgi:hypothetical protein